MSNNITLLFQNCFFFLIQKTEYSIDFPVVNSHIVMFLQAGLSFKIDMTAQKHSTENGTNTRKDLASSSPSSGLVTSSSIESHQQVLSNFIRFISCELKGRK